MNHLIAAERHPTEPSAIAFDNSFARLPERFFVRQPPTPVPSPELMFVNTALAETLGIDPKWLIEPDGIAMLAGNAVPPGAAPLAMVYAGHQFGNWVPRLGDGRALLLGEVVDRNGVRRDIQLKGSGRTPFSRMGDGKAGVGPVLREYIVAEAMAALGIVTTRALSAVRTGEQVAREELLPGAVLCRVANSHIRIGTFEFFASRGDREGLRILADYVIARHYPDVATREHPHRALLARVIDRTAELIASWQLIGFIHGVMNTDNMSIAGETIDYGPCAFMDFYDPRTVYSSIDVVGRYAFGNQPLIAQWNLARLAQALLPLLGESVDEAVAFAQAAIDAFVAEYEAAYSDGLRRKLGLMQALPDDAALAHELLACMARNGADFTLTFRRLAEAAGGAGDDRLRELFAEPQNLDEWLAKWRARLRQETATPQERQSAMRAVNPAFIPRNHRVEAALAAATRGNLSLVRELLQVLAAPFDDQPQFAAYMAPPRPDEIVRQTFCGT
jgi:uncharacterized protein YdiU (UPF0061 family)